VGFSVFRSFFLLSNRFVFDFAHSADFNVCSISLCYLFILRLYTPFYFIPALANPSKVSFNTVICPHSAFFRLRAYLSPYFTQHCLSCLNTLHFLFAFLFAKLACLEMRQFMTQ
jgi:hypothetical protein